MISMLKNAVIELGYENKSGSILYSGNETLRKGNFYFLGANPGGHSDQSNSKYPDTILNQVLRKNSYPSFNEYFDGKWKRSGSRSSLPGHALLQKRIKYLFTKLELDLRSILSTNLVFVRSPTLNKFKLNFNEEAERCWKIHKILLKKVMPKFIIVYGSDATRFICKKMKIQSQDYFQIPSANEVKFFSHYKGILKIDSLELEINLLSVPHLSRFKIDSMGINYGDAYDSQKAILWMKEIIQNFDGRN
jgi:hypothetical protein